MKSMIEMLVSTNFWHAPSRVLMWRKNQLLNLMFQNLKLDGKNLSIQMYEPFTTIRCPKGWGNFDLNQGPTGYEGGGLP